MKTTGGHCLLSAAVTLFAALIAAFDGKHPARLRLRSKPRLRCWWYDKMHLSGLSVPASRPERSPAWKAVIIQPRATPWE